MDASGWRFDFSALPRWDNRERSGWVFDEFHEIAQQDALVCLYSIDEVSMLNYQGFLAILRNKKNPQLVVNVARGYSFWKNFHASEDGRFVFLQACISGHRPLVILDMEKCRFARVLLRNHRPFLKVEQNGDRVFTVEFQEYTRKIRIRWLRWYPFAQLERMHRMR